MVVKKIRKRTNNSRRKSRRRKKVARVPNDVRTGTILAIDPGIKFLGWSVSRVSPEDEEFSVELLDYGTISGGGSRTGLVVDIINQVDTVMSKHNITILGCEDYMHIPGKEQGLFVVPALIGVLKYHWYLRTSKEAIVIPSGTWKKVSCGSGNANKSEVKDAITLRLGKDVMLDIEQMFENTKGKGEQDCIDSIGINLYLCTMVGRNRDSYDISLFRKENK